MDKLIKYARLVFEFKYLDEGKKFEYIISALRHGNARCICAPGIAINYILVVMRNCFIEFNGAGKLVWNKACHRFIPQCSDAKGESWYSNFFIEPCKYIDELCKVRKVEAFVEQEEVDFSYFRNLGNDEIKTRYQIPNGSYRIEKELAFLHGKFGNSKNYVYFFTYIAYEYRSSWKLTEYLDKLFRLYFFMFPEECLRLIKDYSKEMDDRFFYEYNEKVLREYCNIAKRLEEDSSIQALAEFLGIDIDKMLLYYDKIGEKKDLQEVITEKTNWAKQQIGVVTDILENYCIYYGNANVGSDILWGV